MLQAHTKKHIRHVNKLSCALCDILDIEYNNVYNSDIKVFDNSISGVDAYRFYIRNYGTDKKVMSVYGRLKRNKIIHLEYSDAMDTSEDHSPVIYLLLD